MKAQLMSFFLATFLLSSGNASAQQAVVKAGSSKQGSVKCPDISNALIQAKSLKALKTQLQRTPQSELKKCQALLQKDMKLKRHLSSLASKQKREMTRAIKKSVSTKRKSTSSNKLKINQRLKRYQSEGLRRVNALKRKHSNTRTTKAIDNVSRPGGAGPVKASITPTTMVPGLNAAIEGNGIHFGQRQGRVELHIGRQVFPLEITSWQPDWIGVHIPDNISGVPISNTNAAIVVHNGDFNTRTNIKVAFIPVFEEFEVWDAYSLIVDISPLAIFDFDGEQGQGVVFKDAVLQPHWKVTDFELMTFFEGECHWIRPHISTVNSTMETRFNWTTPWMGTVSCSVVATVQGPRGMPSGAEDLPRND